MAKKSEKTSVKKYEQLPDVLRKKLEEANESFSVGDMFFTERGDTVIRIREIKQQKDYDGKSWYVFYDHATTWSASTWSSYGSSEFDKFLKYVTEGTYTKITRPLKEVMDEANKVISGEISIKVYQQNEFANAMNSETALIGRSSKEGLIAIQNALVEKKKTAELIHKAVTWEMEKRKQELENIRQNLYGVVAKFQKQVEKIMRVINTIELYLGIEEELYQILKGEPAPAETPISFRQLVLFIDEEVGSHIDGGLDFRSIDQFDEWISEPAHLNIVLPEKKGVVVLNPRRHNKEYNDDWLNVHWNVPNKLHTYILIRNGDNVYRIFTEKITIRGRLFPRKKELQQLYDRMLKESWDRNKEKIEDEMYQYKNRAMLLQGLLDRTEVFHPLPVERLNLLKLEENEKYVNFIYDAEDALPSGKKSFIEWKASINSKIGHGSRILITSGADATGGKYGSDRIYFECNEYNYPRRPNMGVYEVEEYKGGIRKHWLDDEQLEKINQEGRMAEYIGKSRGGHHIARVKDKLEEKHLTILYNPKDTVYGGWGSYESHNRKKNIRYRIWPDDGFVLNYDQLDLADIDFYLKSRVDREGYLYMMPILKEVLPHLREEAKLESFFVDFVVGRNEDKMLESELRKRTQEAVRWWKYKNKWKRPINKNDALALRMIEQRILSPNYKTFTHH